MRRRFLRAFGRWQRPISWTILVLSLIALVAIVSTLWSVDDPVTAALGALVLAQQAYASVADVENELESDGQATSDDG